MQQHDNDATAPVESELGARIGAVARHITSTVELLEMQQAVIDNLPDAKVIVDEDGIIVMVNRQTELMFGYPRKEMVGQQHEMLLPERFRDIHEKHRHNYCAAPSTRLMGRGEGMELWARRKSGLEFRVDIMLAPIVISSGSYTIAIIRRLAGTTDLKHDVVRGVKLNDQPLGDVEAEAFLANE
jgi:PAS domain S-box-containing protein